MAPRITLLTSNIGRGHPFYLDGILESLIRRGSIGIVKGQTDAFEISRGLARHAWQLTRWLYRRGSSRGTAGTLYSRLRRANDFNKSTAALKVLGRDIRRAFLHGSDPLLVDHPILVGILRGRENLIYQHGELVVPTAAAVRGASVVLVPTRDSAEPFRAIGYSADQIVTSGLCIEPSMVRQAEYAMQLRLTRLDSRTPFTGALYSSGAEPDDHVTSLCEACLSIVQEGGKAIVFAQADGKLHSSIRAATAASGISDLVVTSAEFLPQDLPPILIALYRTRREETALTTRLFPSFDFYVAPSHERSHWALGLGLPMFVLTPPIGEFARLNLQLLQSARVAEILDESLPPSTLGVALRRFRREGHLRRMAERGWGNRKIDGFATIADFLVGRYGE